MRLAPLRLALVCVCSLAALSAFPQGARFDPKLATQHYAPDRTCHLSHLRVDIDVDYANLTFSGHCENTMIPLREGITMVVLNAGPGLNISKLTVDGKPAHYTRDGRSLTIDTEPLRKGKAIVIAIDYRAVNTRGGSFNPNGGGGGGWHWVRQGNGEPNHVGFWTQGETMSNSDWAPTWDYPNDLTTSETHCTVPADWTVIGNGVPVSNKLSGDGKRRTFVWRMDLPHATYLLSLCGGPFDVVHDTWRGVPLWYVVPKGEAEYAPYTFSGTKDMLSFYSDSTGVKYAWPKYAQDAMFDFGGGMENVSATTMEVNVLTEPRDGFRDGDSLISHEMGHQWFGDFVTCKDWGDIWLNESFATFMQMAYFEHSRGKDAYDQEVDDNTRQYLQESRRYKRAISTKVYPSADAMFDEHTYPKGGVVLHTLRRQLGDANYWAGLNYYLTHHAHTPVQTSELCRSITEATGINVEPFFDQWILKPGHPVLDYTWSWDPSGSTVVLQVKQTQDTSGGVPIYNIPAKVGLLSGGKVTRLPIDLNAPSQEFKLPAAAKPDAVLLDPDHDFLREIPKEHWTHDEMVAIVTYGPESGDRMDAMRTLLDGKPAEDDLQVCEKAVEADNGLFPAFRTINAFSRLADPGLRSFFEGLLDSASFSRRAEAVSALGRLPKDPGTVQKLRDQINDKAPISVVLRSIGALSEWDAKGNADVFQKALNIPSRSGAIKHAAQRALDAGK